MPIGQTPWNKGKKLTEEHKEKVRLSRLGQKPSLETRKKMSIAGLGHIVSKEARMKISIANTGKRHSEETRKRLSVIGKGRKIPLEIRQHMSERLKMEWAKGLRKGGWHHSQETKDKLSQVVHSPETRRKIGDALRGEKSGRWISDRTKLKRTSQQGERRTSAYSFWRKSVWARDNWKCRINNSECKGRLEAHHILSWRDYVELRYEINNGITLCHAHHPRKRAEEKRMVSYFQELLSVSKE